MQAPGGRAKFQDGAVRMVGGSLAQCLVSNNLANGTHCVGGGINVSGGGVVRQCIVRQNSMYPSQWCAGSGIYASGATVENCLIANNLASGGNANVDDGSAMDAQSSSIVRNCTVANSGASVTKQSDGLYVYNSTALNCIVSGNTAGVSTIQARIDTGGTVSFSCGPELTTGVNNTTNSPLFKNAAAGDFHLMPHSPCINAGTNYAGMAATDLDGNTRVQNKTVDMGCYELLLTLGTAIFIH